MTVASGQHEQDFERGVAVIYTLERGRVTQGGVGMSAGHYDARITLKPTFSFLAKRQEQGWLAEKSSCHLNSHTNDTRTRKRTCKPLARLPVTDGGGSAHCNPTKPRLTHHIIPCSALFPYSPGRRRAASSGVALRRRRPPPGHLLPRPHR